MQIALNKAYCRPLIRFPLLDPLHQAGTEALQFRQELSGVGCDEKADEKAHDGRLWF
jgi:hypothetical protein